jgi:hypothetical protein
MGGFFVLIIGYLPDLITFLTNSVLCRTNGQRHC